MTQLPLIERIHRVLLMELRLPRIRKDRDLIKWSNLAGPVQEWMDEPCTVTCQYWRFKGRWRRRLFGWRGYGVYY